MLFHSYEFLFLFLPITWGVYATLLRFGSVRTAFSWLTLASLTFYGWWNPHLLPLILTSLIVNYGIARAIQGRSGTRTANSLLVAGLAFNIGLIGYFKYAGLMVLTVNEIAGTAFAIPKIVLPLAISFFTFVEIGFLVEAWRGNLRVPSFMRYSLFVTFFPHLIAGPIVNHTDLLPQLVRDRIRISSTGLAMGLSLFAIGLFKKVVLADHVSTYFQAAYAAVSSGVALTLIPAWIAMTDAAMQIYFDYSGYSDMALGLALLFGIRLPLNFYSPFKATSIPEFWRRWNMTLMRFLRDYSYIPFGGNRHGWFRQAFAILLTMLICGLWHGAGVNDALWGLSIGLLLLASVTWNRYFPHLVKSPPGFASRIARRALVFAGFVLPLAIFMFPNISHGLGVCASMLGLDGIVMPSRYQSAMGPAGQALARAGVEFRSSMPVGIGNDQIFWTLACLLTVYALPNCQQLFGRFRPSMLPNKIAMQPAKFRWRPTIAWALSLSGLFVASLLFMTRVKEFFYFQF